VSRVADNPPGNRALSYRFCLWVDGRCPAKLSVPSREGNSLVPTGRVTYVKGGQEYFQPANVVLIAGYERTENFSGCCDRADLRALSLNAWH